MKRCKEQGEEEKGLARSRGRKERTKPKHVCQGAREKCSILRGKSESLTQRPAELSTEQTHIIHLKCRVNGRERRPVKGHPLEALIQKITAQIKMANGDGDGLR